MNFFDIHRFVSNVTQMFALVSKEENCAFQNLMFRWFVSGKQFVSEFLDPVARADYQSSFWYDRSKACQLIHHSNESVEWTQLTLFVWMIRNYDEKMMFTGSTVSGYVNIYIRTKTKMATFYVIISLKPKPYLFIITPGCFNQQLWLWIDTN